LNDLSSCLKLIHQRRGVTNTSELVLNGRSVPAHRLVPKEGQFYDIWDLPEDQTVLKDISLGQTETVFQFSTPGAIKWLNHFSDRKANGNYGIDSINAMACFTALDRPGPLDVNVVNPDTGQSHNMLVEFVANFQ
jgi:DNA polymerase III alpha subunit